MTTLTPQPTTIPTRTTSTQWLLLLPILLHILVAIGFAHHQTVWLDETTQLEGIALGPAILTAWLTGTPHNFGYPIPPDRMPPLSYYYQQAWAALIHPSIFSLRLSGVLCTTLAVAFTFAIARRLFGPRAALVASLLIALSPQIIERAPEIRAYPLYLALAAAALYTAVRHITAPAGNRFLIATAALLIAACYTHLQAVVFACALSGALLYHHLRARRTLTPAILATLAVAAACAGLAPFVLNSVEVSRHGGTMGTVDKLVALGDLLISPMAHRVHFESLPIMIIALLGGLTLIAATLASKPWQHPAGRLLGTAIALGFLAVTAASLVISAFKPGYVSYNIWMLPAAAILLAYPFRHPRDPAPRRHRIAYLALSLVLAAHVAGSARMAVNGGGLPHGIDPALIPAIHRLNPSQVTVFHDHHPAYAMVQSYYPLAYFFRDSLTQYMPENDAGDFRNEVGGARLRAPDAPTPTIIVIRASGRDFLNMAQDARTPHPPGPAVQALQASPHWRQTSQSTYAAYFKMTTWTFQRTTPQ